MFGGKNKGGLAPLCSRKIKKLREKRQLTQKQLAELSGISESALRSYEPEFDPKMEFFYALLENDELYGYTITEIDGRPAITGGLYTVGLTFDGFLRDWKEMKQRLDAKEITREEYEDWKQTYDPGCWVNTPDGNNPLTGK